MRWCALWSLVFLTFAGSTWLGCGARQETEVQPEPPPPPPPAPTAEPRIWDNEVRYDIGNPITVRIGITNTGETVVNAPEGRHYGVSLRARVGEDEVQCENIAVNPAARGLTPLATSSNTYRRMHVDRLCNIERPGRYLVEITIEVPEVEGGDVSGAMEPLTLEFDVALPDPPVVARVVAGEDTYEAGQPIEATVRITNYGEESVRMAAAGHIRVNLAAAAAGESVPCEEPSRGRGGRGSALGTGESRETTVSLTNRCQMSLPGTYTVTPEIVVPRSGGRSFSGTIEAAPLIIEITPADE